MKKIIYETRSTCRECGDKLVGRSDKKFCCDQCRSAYFNKQNADNNFYIRHINNVLRKNRRILQELFRLEMTRVTPAFLMHKGFSFEHFTHEFTQNAEKKHRFCYEYGYYHAGADQLCLVQFSDLPIHEPG